jgi:hypothetical protein
MQTWPRRFCPRRSQVFLLPLAVVACTCVGRAQPENSEFAVKAAIAGRNIGSRPVRLKRLRAAPEAAACQIVYLSRTSDNLVEETLRQVRGLPVLKLARSLRGRQQ